MQRITTLRLLQRSLRPRTVHFVRRYDAMPPSKIVPGGMKAHTDNIHPFLKQVDDEMWDRAGRDYAPRMARNEEELQEIIAKRHAVFLDFRGRHLILLWALGFGLGFATLFKNVYLGSGSLPFRKTAEMSHTLREWPPGYGPFDDPEGLKQYPPPMWENTVNEDADAPF
eukprot:190335_1